MECVITHCSWTAIDIHTPVVFPYKFSRLRRFPFDFDAQIYQFESALKLEEARPTKEKTWFKNAQRRRALLDYISDRLADIAFHISETAHLKVSLSFSHCSHLLSQIKGMVGLHESFKPSGCICTILDTLTRARPEPKPPPRPVLPWTFQMWAV